MFFLCYCVCALLLLRVCAADDDCALRTKCDACVTIVGRVSFNETAFVSPCVWCHLESTERGSECVRACARVILQ